MELRVLPGSGGRLLSVGQGRAAAPLLAMVGASSRLRATAAALGDVSVRLLGDRATRPIQLGDEVMFGLSAAELERELSEQALAPFEMLAIRLPAQAERKRLVVLGRQRGATLVVKIGAADGRLDTEYEILQRLVRDPIPLVRTPSVVSGGSLSLGGELSSFVACRLTRPAHSKAAFSAPFDTIERGIEKIVGTTAPPEVPDHWRPAHGDLAPWNLRRSSYGLVLFDWEHCDWAPPLADRVYFNACCAALRGQPMPEGLPTESVEYWTDKVAARNDPHDRGLNQRLLSALADAQRWAVGATRR